MLSEGLRLPSLVSDVRGDAEAEPDADAGAEAEAEPDVEPDAETASNLASDLLLSDLELETDPLGREAGLTDLVCSLDVETAALALSETASEMVGICVDTVLTMLLELLVRDVGSDPDWVLIEPRVVEDPDLDNAVTSTMTMIGMLGKISAIIIITKTGKLVTYSSHRGMEEWAHPWTRYYHGSC